MWTAHGADGRRTGRDGYRAAVWNHRLARSPPTAPGAAPVTSASSSDGRSRPLQRDHRCAGRPCRPHHRPPAPGRAQWSHRRRARRRRPPHTAARGVFTGNGYGKLIGTTQLTELGTLETPVLLTSTLSAFRVADALVGWMLERPGCDEVQSLNPVVGECNDGFLSDIRARPVHEEHVRAALDGASGWRRPRPRRRGHRHGRPGIQGRYRNRSPRWIWQASFHRGRPGAGELRRHPGRRPHRHTVTVRGPRPRPMGARRSWRRPAPA
ncbi:hypothetical protein SHIRM173S_06792 [Streptomyces hirsutus]